VSEPVIDHYGRRLTVEPHTTPAGPAVYLDISGIAEFFRLTPDKAIELGKQLQRVGEEQS